MFNNLRLHLLHETCLASCFRIQVVAVGLVLFREFVSSNVLVSVVD